MSLLALQGISTGYGREDVVRDIHLTLHPSEIVTLLGHNGAGKTTTLKAVFGMMPVRHGVVTFGSDDITNSNSTDNVRRGLRYMPEDRFVFPNLSVVENLKLGGFAMEDRSRLADIDEVLDFVPALKERGKQRAGTLSGGERRMLSVGMMLVSRPSCLLLDEPSLGLAPILVEHLMELVKRLVDDWGMSVLMVEQNVEQALRFADRAYVMRSGEIIHEEQADSLRDRHDWWDLF